MKKILVAVMTALLVLTGCSKGPTTTIKSNDVIDKIENKEDFIVYFGKDGCAACVEFAPVVDEMNKDYQGVINYVDIDHDDNEARKNLIDNYKVDLMYTPTVFFFKEGEVVDKMVGASKYSELEKNIVKHGFDSDEQ